MTQHDSPAGPKPASAATKAAQARAVLEQLPFSDQADFAQARRGFIFHSTGKNLRLQAEPL